MADCTFSVFNQKDIILLDSGSRARWNLPDLATTYGLPTPAANFLPLLPKYEISFCIRSHKEYSIILFFCLINRNPHYFYCITIIYVYNIIPLPRCVFCYVPYICISVFVSTLPNSTSI